jgi:DNA polymerase epsilon subunit 2
MTCLQRGLIYSGSNPLVDAEKLSPVLKTLDVPHISRSTSFILSSSQPTPSLYESQPIDTLTYNHNPSNIDPIQFFSVIEAFSQPKYTYDSTTKQFQQSPKPSIIAAPKEKATIFRERYEIILQRLLRNELFQSLPTYTQQKYQTAGKISSIKTLLGRRNQHFLLFGLLNRAPSGVISLSDPDGSIQLDLTDAVSAGGIISVGSFILVDGKYTDKNVFRVHTVAMPPSEKREISKQIFGHIDFLGAKEASLKGGIVPVEREYEKFLLKAERAAGSIRFIFAGELNLDNPRVATFFKINFNT